MYLLNIGIRSLVKVFKSIRTFPEYICPNMYEKQLSIKNNNVKYKLMMTSEKLMS